MVQIKHLPESERRRLYTDLRWSVTQRSNAFRKAGLWPMRPAIMVDLKPAKETSIDKINRVLGAAKGYLQGQLYTKAGYQRYHKQRRKELSEKLGVNLNDEDYKKYTKFMNDMARQMGAGWHYVSSQAVELFAQAKRLNLNVNQFKRNLDYWIDNADKLAYAKPIKRGSGVKPSDYIKQLKMETVTSWKKKMLDKERDRYSRMNDAADKFAKGKIFNG